MAGRPLIAERVLEAPEGPRLRITVSARGENRAALQAIADRLAASVSGVIGIDVAVVSSEGSASEGS